MGAIEQVVQLYLAQKIEVFSLLLQFGEYLSVRVEEIISCVDGEFLSTLLNKKILLLGFSPELGFCLVL